MSPDDPRHGKRSGYIAGCRGECCSEPHYRYQKRSKLRLLREGSQIVPAHRVLARTLWWQARGVSQAGITRAAKVGDGTLREIVSGERGVCLRATERAILAVDWDSLPGDCLVDATLTRLRIDSLRAAGHPLAWIAANGNFPITGRWRYQDRMQLGMARSVQSLYATAPLVGPSKHSATRALNAGHRPPLAWDDPGVPAMPRGWMPFTEVAA